MISGAHAMAAHVLGMPVVAVASRSQEKSTERAKQLNANKCTYGHAKTRWRGKPRTQQFKVAMPNLQRTKAAEAAQVGRDTLRRQYTHSWLRSRVTAKSTEPTTRPH